jgi:hypothetical protein
MAEINFVLLFLYVFSLLIVIKNIIKFFFSVFKNPPEKLNLSAQEAFIFYLSASYAITYTITYI